MHPLPVLTQPYQSGRWYRLPGYGHNSPQLVFSDVGTRFIYQNQDIQIWYGEDLYDQTVSNILALGMNCILLIRYLFRD